MPVTFAPAAVVPQLVAASALTQLNRTAVFARAARGDYEAKTFQKGDTVTVRRARIVRSQNYDPRSGTPANSTEPGYVSATLTLDALFTAGFPVYGQDNNDSAQKYVTEYGQQIAAAIATDCDEYFYGKFRSVSVAASGLVAYGAQPPVAIVAADSAGLLRDFSKTQLINANTRLDTENVPPGDRFAILSTAAKGAFLGDSVLVEGFTATAAGSAALLQGGIPIGSFVPRYGFQVGGSNSVGSQTGVADLDTAAGNSATLPIASVVADANFTIADFATSTPLGAVVITLTVGTALQGVAVGQIARIGTGGNTTAYGLVLRVASNVVTVVPFAPSGKKLVAAQITPGTDVFSIPDIGSISVAHHRESLLFTTRNLAAPSDGSGASMTTIADDLTGMVIQILRGSYKVDEFKESQRYATLLGALLSDHRKAVLILSN